MNVATQEMYSEVYSILNLLGNSYIAKLPKSLFKMIEEESLVHIIHNIEKIKA